MFTSGTEWAPSFMCRGWCISLAQKWQEMQTRISEKTKGDVSFRQGFTLSCFLYCVFSSQCSAFPE